MRLTALSAMNEPVRIRNLPYTNAQDLTLDINGIGSTTFTSRTCLIGLYVENCGRMRLGQLVAKKFALAAFWAGTSNNNMMQIGSIVADSIGSGRSSQSLTANWSAPVNSGSSGSTGQATQITVDALPSATIQAYEAIGVGQLQVRIAGYLYYVNSISGSNVSIYPWLDNASVSAGTGTLEWVFGGAFCTRTTDSNLIEVGVLDASNSSRTLSDAALYGSKIRDMQSNTVGTEICLGKAVSSACFGTKVRDRYIEGGGAAPHEQIAIISAFGASNYYEILGDSGAPDLSKCWALGNPRVTAGTIQGGEFGATTAGAGATMVSSRGRLLQYHKANLNNLPAATINLRGQIRGPQIEVYRKDSATFLLNVEGSGEYNRLFGFSGGTALVFGTGPNGAPSGTIVFTPPTGGTINGGSVNATASFSGFIGPALFSYEHTDTAQLTWIVRPLTGFIASSAVTYANIQNVAASRLLGNASASAAAPAEIPLAGGLVFASGALSAAGPLTPTSVAIGSGGTALTKAVVYTPTLTPASVAAATIAEQTFVVTGLTTADKVIVNPPAIGNATGIVGARVSAADTLAIRFANPTAGALTPSSGVYTLIAFRS